MCRFPWLVPVVFRGSSSPGGCGATLVAAEWAVTAAHCGTGITHIVLGEHDLRHHSHDRYHSQARIW